MARRVTREELQKKVRDLQAAEEAFFCFQKAALEDGALPEIRKFTSGEVTLFVIGLDRLSGGVIIGDAGCRWYRWVSDWVACCSGSGDPYLADLARQLVRAQTAAVEARYGKVATSS